MLVLAQAPQPQAESKPDEPPPPGLYTLHVYANLTQVPTLIMDPDGKPVPQLARDKFFVSLDSGPLFHPPQLRVEGDDPISLAIIIDDSGDESNFISNIAETLAKLAPKDLHPKDNVSIYAIDCKAVESVDEAPASSEVIRGAVSSVLAAPTLHGQKRKPSCAGSVHLWDIMAHAAQRLGEMPSRRVILVISLGMESGSATDLDSLIYLAQSKSVAIFGLRDVDEFAYQRSFHDQSTRGLSGVSTHGYPQDRLSILAAATGGLIYNRRHPQIEDALHSFVAALRDRYIVEFPRPDNGIPGAHQIAITVPSKPNFILRYTGASMPLPDQDVLKDPNTVPAAPSPATFGNQRPKKQ
jgi:VWFA-related protein